MGETMRMNTAARTLITIAAVSLVANGAICAERMVVDEHFTRIG